MGNRNKAKGTAFETLVKEYLISKGFPEARRAALEGADDKGDIHGIASTETSRKVCIQCKNDKSFNISGWLNDTVEQAKRLGDAVPALVVKRKGKGEKALGDSYVVMRLDDLVDLLQEARYS
jgi:hypothetical protein